MKTKHKVEELEAHVEHLQERIDGLRDDIQELEATLRPTCAMKYFWDKFEDTLAWCQKYDANSAEWKKLNSLVWKMLDKYLNALSNSHWGKDGTD